MSSDSLSDRSSTDKVWDAQRYQSQHSYVFKHGEGLVDLLDPKPGERILDLGCGSGQLTARIAEAGATVIGMDLSPDMIAQARANFPEIDFRIGDAAAFEVEEPVEAVFSNAVLHWVQNAEAAIERVHRALKPRGAGKPGGRFVMEMGGKGNTRALLAAVAEVAGPVTSTARTTPGGCALESPWFYPSVGEYAGMLEKHGFEVRFAALFDRPTEVGGENGLEEWLVMFGGKLFTGIPESRQSEIRKAVAEKLRPAMYRDGKWILDYRRLRVVAVKTS
jgi:trans-aconitate methyltransferase